MSSSFASTRLSYDAASRSWSEPLPELDSPRTLVLCFGASHFEPFQEALDAIQRVYPSSVILGCSTSGEIHGTEVRDDSLCVGIVRFAHTELSVVSASIDHSEDSYEVGARIARELWREDLRAVLILSDGLIVNGSALVRGVNSQLPGEVIVTGGLAGDGPRFEKTWILEGGECVSNAISAVGFYGDHLRMGHGSQGGWDKFGPVRSITRSEGNVLYELDGKPALALYKTYLGDRAKELPASGLLFPISLLDLGSEERNVVRTLLAVDHEEQSLTFAGDVPEGTRIQLMRAHFERLVEGARDAASLANVEDLDSSLVIAVSCVGRRLVLEERASEELVAVERSLGESSTLVGFYSYGELSPVEDGRCDLHNQTMTLTVIGESPEPLGLPLLEYAAPRLKASQEEHATPRSRRANTPGEDDEANAQEKKKKMPHDDVTQESQESHEPQRSSTWRFLLIAVILAAIVVALAVMQ